MLYFETGDNRLCLAYPIGDRVLMGTTDIRVDDPDTAKCEDNEVDYLLSEMASLLPGVTITRDHIVYRYLGVRPLPFDDGVGVGSVSRDHSIEVDEASDTRSFTVASLVGGKWTTFRGFGETSADFVMQRLGVQRSNTTHDLSIGGGRNYPQEAQKQAFITQLAKEFGLEQGLVGEIIERYGCNKALFETLAAENGAEPLKSIAHYRIGEFQYMCEHELVAHLDDILFRRSTLALEGRGTAAVVAEIASIAAPIMGWDATAVQVEIDRCNLRIENDGRVVALS